MVATDVAKTERSCSMNSAGLRSGDCDASSGPLKRIMRPDGSARRRIVTGQ